MAGQQASTAGFRSSGLPASEPETLRDRAGVVSYGRADNASAEYKALIRTLIRDNSAVSICDIGGGTRPTLPADYVSNNGLQYSVVDISPEELDKADPRYRKIVADICAPDLAVSGGFDLVCSRMLAEHIKDPRTFHRNVHRMLRVGGIALHFFPTLYAAPFLVNRLLPERLTQGLQQCFAPRDTVLGKKFPAYYAWCRGPTRRQIRRFEKLGYSVLSYRGFFGHNYYAKLAALHGVQDRVTRFLLRHPVPAMTSYVHVVLRKERREPPEVG
jgi:SAM-dependent methyltransferase